MKYLIVDDETAICQGTARRLRRILPDGDTVTCAYSGEEALKCAADDPPDILITDIRMGAMDGLQLIEQLHRQRPNIACVIITAFDNFKYAQQAIRLDVKDFLVKPYGEEDLRNAVEKVASALERNRQQSRALLEKKLYECLLEGGKPDRQLFTQFGLADPPEALRVICWDLRASAVPCWRGSWCFCDENRRYLLVGEDWDALSDWLRRFDDADAHIGISRAGDELGALWKQAQQALRVSGYDNMPRRVFFQEAFFDERQLRQDHAVLWAMNYIAEHAGQPISMEDICSRLHLNYSYFSRQFKRQTGIPFSEYLLRSQMSWALEYIKSGKRTSEAADMLGYRSAESFGKAFSRVYGSTPRNYLNHRQDD